MKKVFVTRDIISDGLQYLQYKGFIVEVWTEARPMTSDELSNAAAKSDALICMLSDSIDKKFLTKHAHLKIICNYAVGLNNIDLTAAKELGVTIGNTPDVLTEATAETALGLMIASARKFQSASQAAKTGSWKDFEPQGHLGIALKNKVLGILGAGRIGKRLAEMATGAFHMDVRLFKRGDNLNAFLKELDVLSIHLPLTDETKKFIGKFELAQMKETAILINTARGEVIDQDALTEALTHKKLFAAGLDVTTPEPLPLNHPLWALPNVFILPHIGSATYEARREMSMLCALKIEKVFNT